MDWSSFLAVLAPLAAALTVVAQSRNLTLSARLRSALKDQVQIAQALPNGKSRRDLMGLIDEQVQRLVAHERRPRLRLGWLVGSGFTGLVGFLAVPGASGWFLAIGLFDAIAGVAAVVWELGRFAHQRWRKPRLAQRSMSTNRT